jgi:hypothetical protein|tara:strand:- start:126 stop:350 length:225 start_codon:yes stop_codon:yes gene_type:complete
LRSADFYCLLDLESLYFGLAPASGLSGVVAKPGLVYSLSKVVIKGDLVALYFDMGTFFEVVELPKPEGLLFLSL